MVLNRETDFDQIKKNEKGKFTRKILFSLKTEPQHTYFVVTKEERAH